MNQAGIKHHREIEQKFRIKGMMLDEMYNTISKMRDIDFLKGLTSCITKDIYFPSHKSVSIIRLRDSYGIDDNDFSKSLKEVTIKIKDTATNLNRLEENLEIRDSLSAFKILKLLFGNPKLILNKDERVLWTKDGMIISLAQVNNESDIFFEIEGPTEELVKKYSDLFQTKFKMMKEPRSLFEIFG